MFFTKVWTCLYCRDYVICMISQLLHNIISSTSKSAPDLHVGAMIYLDFHCRWSKFLVVCCFQAAVKPPHDDTMLSCVRQIVPQLFSEQDSQLLFSISARNNPGKLFKLSVSDVEITSKSKCSFIIFIYIFGKKELNDYIIGSFTSKLLH